MIDKTVFWFLVALYWAIRGAIVVFGAWWLFRGWQIWSSTDYSTIGEQKAYHVVLLVIVGLVLFSGYMLTSELFEPEEDFDEEVTQAIEKEQ
ncbi:MAG TPA: hypothetical protein VIT65_22375 [Microlunatus sp.]